MSGPSGSGTHGPNAPEPGASARASSSRKTRITTALGAALFIKVIVVATVVSAVSLTSVMGCSPHHGQHGDPERMREFANPRELLARIRAVLRRRTPEGQRGETMPLLRFGRLEVDRDAREARKDGAPCPLTSYQFELLRILAESAGRVVSRDTLMEQLRGDALTAFDRSIDVHVSRIRAAIEDDPKHPKRLLTVRGVGYLFSRSQDEKPPV